ncbi:MAG: hypothetical protein QNK11_05395 [Legionella sp.]|nr:hypothetical protein [Legionella sp.]
MKRIIFSLTALLCASFTTAYAGPMGKPKEPLPVLIPFLAGEGMYTWPQGNAGLDVSVPGIGDFNATTNKVGWGGRIAAGALHPLSEKWAGSAEVGWGYYGSFSSVPSVTFASGTSSAARARVTASSLGNSLNSYSTLYGFDILAGLYYLRPKYDLFFKAGALVQNFRTKIFINPTGLIGHTLGQSVNRFPGTYQLNANIVNVLPEIKLGGGYHVKKNWLVTAAWMHAFGRKLDTSKLGMTVNPFTITKFSGFIYTPTLNTVLLGLEYRFA